MRLLWMGLFSFGIVAADQITKYLVVANIPLYAQEAFLPGILSLTYVQNTGAAFSLLSGQRWLFVAVFAVLTGLLLWEYFKKPLPFSTFERWCFAAIYGGGLRNALDRIFRGYVVDMLKTDFIRFPVFNVADCFITCGCIALIFSLAFLNKGFWKEETK